MRLLWLALFTLTIAVAGYFVHGENYPALFPVGFCLLVLGNMMRVRCKN